LNVRHARRHQHEPRKTHGFQRTSRGANIARMTRFDEHEARRREAAAQVGYSGIGGMVGVVHDGTLQAKDAYGSANSEPGPNYVWAQRQIEDDNCRPTTC
jgi:hypothetical protein